MKDKIYSVLEKYGIDEPKASAITEDLLFLCAVVKSFVCDIEKGTRCKDSFPDYKDGKCRICGGQAN